MERHFKRSIHVSIATHESKFQTTLSILGDGHISEYIINVLSEGLNVSKKGHV